MSYTLGTFIPLLGGGYATANQRPGTAEGYPSIDLYVQLYDANKQPIGASVVVAQAYSNPTTGRYATITGYDLVAAPYGGFIVGYTGPANKLGWESNIQAGVIFDAKGQVVTPFGYDYAVAIPTPPHIIPLLNGGVIVQQDWSFWVYDAQGKNLGQSANSGGPIYDMGTVVIQTIPHSDGTADQLLFRFTGTGAPVLGSALVKTLTGGSGDDVLGGSAGPDSIVGGAGADILTGGFGFDVLTGGAGVDRFVLGVDGSVDRITDFDAATETLKLTDLQGGALSSPSTGVLTFDARSHLLYWDDDGAAGPHEPITVAMLEGVDRIGLANLVGFQPARLVNIVGLGAYEVIGSGALTGGAAADILTGGDGPTP